MFCEKKRKLVGMIGKEGKSPDETRGKTARKEITMNVVFRIIALFRLSGDNWRVYITDMRQ